MKRLFNMLWPTTPPFKDMTLCTTKFEWIQTLRHNIRHKDALLPYIARWIGLNITNFILGSVSYVIHPILAATFFSGMAVGFCMLSILSVVFLRLTYPLQI